MEQSPPAPDTDEYTPTVEELREIAEFLRQRSLNEAGAAGIMDSYRQSGVTTEVSIPDGAFATREYGDEVRRNAEGWLGEHSPGRFVDLAHELANLGYALSNAGVDAVYQYQSSPYLGPYRVREVWGSLTRAARLWEQHPDFKPAWAKVKEPPVG